MELTFFNWRKLGASNPLGELAALRRENSQSLENIQEALLGSTSPTTILSRPEREMWPPSLAATWLEKTTGLLLQLSILINAAFFLPSKHKMSWGEATRCLCGH